MSLDLNYAVFTTSYVIEKMSAIVYVVHDKDGDWQFFGNEKDVDEQNGRVVSLGEIIKIDRTIEEILWIPLSTEARRDKIGAEWTTAFYSQ